MAETWVLNESIPIAENEHTWNVNFTSNGITYTELTWDASLKLILKYNSTVVFKEAPAPSWLDQAYRTITFLETPTGDLLTWLQANGVKQSKPANKVIIGTETIIDLTQDTVTPDKLVSGVTAHDKSGKQITGTMEELAGLAYTGVGISPGNQNNFLIPAANSGDTGYVKGEGEQTVDVFVPRGIFGAATADQVLKGKTFSSFEGIAQTGTYVPLDTSDATVTAGDMARNVIAYGKDGKVTGTLSSVASVFADATSMSQIGNAIEIDAQTTLAKRILKQNPLISIIATPSQFGNATAADVAAGKTFTSAAGLKVVGTAAGSSAADVTFDLYNNDFDDLAVVYMAKSTITQVTIPLSDHKGITTPEGSIVALIDQRFKGDTIDLVPTSGSITQGWRDSNITLFVAGAETNGMNIDVNMT